MKLTDKCRHCQQRNAIRPRGLCWRCYYTPGVKDLYPVTSKFAPRTAPKPATTLCKPTTTLPGTEEKIKVLAERVQRCEKLWHPADSKRTTN